MDKLLLLLLKDKLLLLLGNTRFKEECLGSCPLFHWATSLLLTSLSFIISLFLGLDLGGLFLGLFGTAVRFCILFAPLVDGGHVTPEGTRGQESLPTDVAGEGGGGGEVVVPGPLVDVQVVLLCSAVLAAVAGKRLLARVGQLVAAELVPLAKAATALVALVTFHVLESEENGTVLICDKKASLTGKFKCPLCIIELERYLISSVGVS